MPYAAGIPGEVRFIYIPGNDSYQVKVPLVKGLEPKVRYLAFLFDPTWAKRIDLGVVERIVGSNDYQPSQLPSPQDWVLVLEK